MPRLPDGERAEATEKKEKTLRLHERLEKRFERRFERRFELPAEIDGEHVASEYTKGLLTVHVPKISHEKLHKVEITKA
jgi:HSP20 family molecular chaperone IbpA